MDMSQYLEIFIEESKEHLQNLNQSLLQMEKNPKDTGMLNEIFRVAHTLKGMSGTMGYTRMAKLTHDMENVLHSLRSGELNVNTRLVDLLFQCLDALENYLNNIISSSNEGGNDYGDIIQALHDTIHKKDQGESVAVKNEATAVVEAAGGNLSGHPTADVPINQYEQNVINKARDMGMNAFKITVVLNKSCVLKSARAFIIFQTLERFSEVIKAEPSVQDIEDEKFHNEFTVVLITKESKELFINEINSISEIDDVVVVPLEKKAIETVEGAGDEIPDGDKKSNVSIQAVEIGKEESEVSKQSMSAKTKTGKTVRVDIERLDVLMNLVSELIICKTKLEGIDDIDRTQRFDDEVDTLERITTSLHDAVMKVRMVPVETVFNRFPRMLRDLSKELEKEIDLTMSGEETELDRTVIDEIGDPLIHLLRNAMDHGIESAERRRQLGKPETGHIWLKAYQDGNNVVIEVAEDGQGINVEKVKLKAVEKGVISREAANGLSQKDAIDLLFLPSFSTAEKITDVSGRGVGLDVVQTKIEALGGAVEVQTELDKGTKFIIRLPLTLAIIQALLVLIGQEKFAVPLSSIKEIINISNSDIKYVQKQEVILLRNTVVPIVRLDNVLGVPKEETDIKQLTVVIVRKGDKLSGFLVDSLIGQQEIVIKSLGKLLSGIKSIAGATILGDGNVALILDINSIA